MVSGFFTGSQLSAGKVVGTVKPFVKEPLAKRYDRLYQEISRAYPGAQSTSFSVRKGGELRLRLIYPYRWARNQNTFFFDEAGGQLLRTKLYKTFNGADLVEATNYDLHTGRLFGLFGKVVAFIASLISATLPITGFIIWLKKKRNRRKKLSQPKTFSSPSKAAQTI